MPKGRSKLTRSSGNVFRDLGFSSAEAEHLRVRADLMLKIEKVLKARKLRQAEAAKIMGVSQPRVSDLLRGRIDLFSSDTLIEISTTWPAYDPRQPSYEAKRLASS
jgi:predicted XRE-type DNA-binding protein